MPMGLSFEVVSIETLNGKMIYTLISTGELMTEKCESCRRGLNGRNDNGYSPCGCGKRVVVIGIPSRANNLIRAMCCALSRPPKKP